jgi:tRNA-splicing ligase RtcB
VSTVASRSDVDAPGEKIRTFVPWSEIDEQARAQILNVSRLPFLYKWVAVMPDCHCGIGATVGTVIATRGALVPAAVGVDIGCGMISLETPLKGRDLGSLHALRAGIERRIPMSAGKNNEKISRTAAPRIAELKRLEAETGASYARFDPDWQHALGTLGGGNHFIEVCLDESDTVWLTVHSGSRGVGNRIGNHYIQLARDRCRSASIALPDRDLAYLEEGTPELDGYVRDLRWAQAFARLNRDEMMDRILEEMSYAMFGEGGHERELESSRIDCHHNFAQIEHHFGRDVWITRKGAIQAELGMRGMIPGSMGARSYIVSGLGNADAFHSAPHGAGRRLSRTKAKGTFTMKDMETEMAGIEFRKSPVLLDEIPSAYKDIDQVMRHSAELVKIEHTLRQIVNCKGD